MRSCRATQAHGSSVSSSHSALWELLLPRPPLSNTDGMNVSLEHSTAQHSTGRQAHHRTQAPTAIPRQQHAPDHGRQGLSKLREELYRADDRRCGEGGREGGDEAATHGHSRRRLKLQQQRRCRRHAAAPAIDAGRRWRYMSSSTRSDTTCTRRDNSEGWHTATPTVAGETANKHASTPRHSVAVTHQG